MICRHLLGWMRSLLSLVITKRYCFQQEMTKTILDPYLMNLLDSMFRQPAISLRRLWIDDNHYGYFRNGLAIAGQLQAASSLTSLVVGFGDFHENMHLILDNEKYRHLKHFGCLRFERLAQLPDLQYACGNWDGYHAVIDSFYFSSHKIFVKRHFIFLGA